MRHPAWNKGVFCTPHNGTVGRGCVSNFPLQNKSWEISNHNPCFKSISIIISYQCSGNSGMKHLFHPNLLMWIYLHKTYIQVCKHLKLSFKKTKPETIRPWAHIYFYTYNHCLHWSSILKYGQHFIMWKAFQFTKLKFLAVIPRSRPANVNAKPQWDFLTHTALKEEALARKPHVQLSTMVRLMKLYEVEG